MSGFNTEDKEDKQSYQKMLALCICVASLVMLIFLIILYINSKDDTKVSVNKEVEINKEDDFLKDANNIRSEDLSFWKNYESIEDLPSDEEEGNTTPYVSGESNAQGEESADDTDLQIDSNVSSSDITRDDVNDNADNSEAADSGENIFDDDINSSDGNRSDGSDNSLESDNNNGVNVKKKKISSEDKDKNGLVKEEEKDESMTKQADDDPDTIEESEKASHIAVVDDKGNRKLYEILKDADKNTLDLKNNIIEEKGRLSYEDDKIKAKTGIDLSKYNGSVDFGKVKEDNISFAMLRIASRGYDTGTMLLDEKFVEYAQGAKANDIPIGVYVFSQATSDVEAVEEANYAIGAITNFGVTYPVAVDIEVAKDNSYRTRNVTAKERTRYAKLFCDTVSSYGYHPVIYANRDLLITGLNMDELAGYDIWLSDDKVPTDFPYKFNLWQYNTKGSVAGIDGDVDLNLSFELK